MKCHVVHVQTDHGILSPFDCRKECLHNIPKLHREHNNSVVTGAKLGLRNIPSLHILPNKSDWVREGWRWPHSFAYLMDCARSKWYGTAAIATAADDGDKEKSGSEGGSDAIVT